MSGLRSVTVPGVIVTLCLALWLLGTLLSQFESAYLSTIRRWDKLNIVPRWTFFAPRPCVSDFHLIFRDIDVAGRLTPWEDAQLNGERSLMSCVWNPSKRRSKSLFDVVQLFATMPVASEMPLCSLPYIWSLHVCMTHPRHPSAVRRQFAIAAINHASVATELSVVFASGEHPFV